jgi:hypothetical protein
MRRTLRQFRVFLETNPYTSGAAARISRRARIAIFLYRLSLRILAQWARDKCPQQAAALAFQTALSLVPITAIVFSLLRGFGSLESESRLSQFVSERLFPQLPDVTDKIREFSGKVSIGALGGGGLLFTLVTCYSLYSYVEKIFNDIWRVGERRTLIGKFLTFYAMVTLLPTLAAFSLYWSGKLVGSGSVSRFIMPAIVDRSPVRAIFCQRTSAHRRFSLSEHHQKPTDSLVRFELWEGLHAPTNSHAQRRGVVSGAWGGAVGHAPGGL